MASQNSSILISHIYNSRKVVLELMKKQGYNVNDYANFSINEVNSMKLNNQLDMLLETSDENISKGKELYNIYCAVCHGSKGDGQGILMTNEKFLGIPSYADRDITEGSIYHVLMYGKNLMGSHASQVNAKERWQISQYVISLREKLIK